MPVIMYLILPAISLLTLRSLYFSSRWSTHHETTDHFCSILKIIYITMNIKHHTVQVGASLPVQNHLWKIHAFSGHLHWLSLSVLIVTSSCQTETRTSKYIKVYMAAASSRHLLFFNHITIRSSLHFLTLWRPDNIQFEVISVWPLQEYL